MNLLLDTCSFLWAMHSPSRLSTTARKALQESSNTVQVSVITFWEIGIKTGLGKLRIKGVTPEEYPALTLEAGWVVHPLDAEVAASTVRLPTVPNHRDPFDRLLVWTALQKDLTLLSGNAAISRYAPHGLKVCW